LKKPGFDNKEYFVDSIGGLETLSESLALQIMFHCTLYLQMRLGV